MITPNLSIKLVIIYTLFFGFASLICLNGLNRILGIFLIYYAYINLLSLRNKGKKQFKLGLLKVNIYILGLIILVLNYKAITNKNKNKSEVEVGFILLLLIPIVANWISIRNYKL
jgi:hypothetical protein